MEYACFQGMPQSLPLFMEDRSIACTTVYSISNSSSIPLDILDEQQQITPNCYYNPQFNFPAVSWSTTDPTLLVTGEQQQQQQQRPVVMLNSSNCLNAPCGNSKNFPNYINHAAEGVDPSCCVFTSFASEEYLKSSINHHHAVGNNSIADQLNLGLPVDTTGSSSSNAISCSSMDPLFSAVGGGGGDVLHSQWLQTCSLLSDQYYSYDASMPQLVSDYYLDPQQHQRPSMYYSSSTSVDCCGVHESDSCGSSDRDKSTTSEEINWTNKSSNNLDMIQQQQGGNSLLTVGSRSRNSVTGLMLTPATRELSDDYSSSIAAAVDDVEFASGRVITTTTSPLDLRQRHWGTEGTNEAKCGVPTGRGSWMPTSSSSVQVKSHVPALDPLLLLDSIAGAASSSMQLSSASTSNGLLPPPSSRGPCKPQQRACYTLDNINIPMRPQPMLATQTRSISQRLSSGPPIPPFVNHDVDRNTRSSSLYKDFYSFPSSQLNLPSSGPVAAAGLQGISVGGYGSKTDYSSPDQLMLLSPRKLHNATSIEPQSVAARHRRKKISERVSVLEKLIPGGSKMDTASMLDEAIQYVKFLQLQVQLLESMGEMENFKTSLHSRMSLPATGEGCTGTSSTHPSVTTTTIIKTSSEPAFHFHNNGKAGNSARISRLGPSASLQQSASRSTAASSVSTTNSTPLILSEVLQEQLFKQKLCLVSLRQYGPHQQLHAQQQIRPSC